MPYVRHRRRIPWNLWDYSICVVLLSIAGCAFLYALQVFWPN
jgi:hypothetical protein